MLEPTYFSRYVPGILFTPSICGLILILAATVSLAQVKPASTKAIDTRADRLKEQFVRDAARLAQEYENAGNLPKAQEMLSVILKMTPGHAGVRDKIRELEELQVTSNELTFDLDLKTGWSRPVARVSKGGQVRIVAEGNYRINFTAVLDADGLKGQDAVQGGYAEELRYGQLIGLIAPATGNTGPQTRGNRGRKSQDETPKPFAIGMKDEFSPKESGVLFLRVNVPNNCTVTGRLKVTISGEVTPMS
ncbi:hypothetical protein [Calycomorphotria hydatis]|uniref:Uncharacterized protein n=1 Tax=Calycomorphotria hydatis TaxID=2528027 RepID=A0A517TB37_9PLAN|nr:hypothetical protein [Calycomorphotria hydatis]QDT65586.1 hypothetical protein V22_28410 [Calycomorphotria hydatis]